MLAWYYQALIVLIVVVAIQLLKPIFKQFSPSSPKERTIMNDEQYLRSLPPQGVVEHERLRAEQRQAAERVRKSLRYKEMEEALRRRLKELETRRSPFINHEGSSYLWNTVCFDRHKDHGRKARREWLELRRLLGYTEQENMEWCYREVFGDADDDVSTSSE